MAFARKWGGLFATIILAAAIPAAAAFAAPAFDTELRRAEQAFRAGKAADGAALLTPFLEAEPDIDRDAAVQGVLEQHPSAAPAFAGRVRRAVRTFHGKRGALRAARLLAWSESAGVLAPEQAEPLRAALTRRALAENGNGKADWFLTDPYPDVPGLDSPDSVRRIFRRTLDHAVRTRSEAAAASLLDYLERTPDDQDAHSRLLAALPDLPMSERFAARLTPLHPEVPYTGRPVTGEVDWPSWEVERLRWGLDSERLERRAERRHDRHERTAAVERTLRDMERRLAAEQAQRTEEHRRAEERRQAEEQRRAENKKRADEFRRAEERRQAEERRRAEEQKRAEGLKRAEEHHRAEEQKRADERRHAEEQKRADERRRAEEKKQADERRRAEEQKRADEHRRAEERRRAQEARQAEEQRRREAEQRQAKR